MPQNSDTQFDPSLGYRILNWIGIIEQLSRTKANRETNEIGLPWNQFVLLNHFSHRPEEGKTVTSVARAMQQQQPGVTKTMKAMVEKGFLRLEEDKDDRRVKHHFLTTEGIRIHRDAIARILPMVGDLFAGWTPEEMAHLFKALDRIKVNLDENR